MEQFKSLCEMNKAKENNDVTTKEVVHQNCCDGREIVSQLLNSGRKIVSQISTETMGHSPGDRDRCNDYQRRSRYWPSVFQKLWRYSLEG